MHKFVYVGTWKWMCFYHFALLKLILSCIVLISLNESSKIAAQTKIAQRPQFTGN